MQLDVEYIIPNQKQKYRSETNTIYDIISEVKDKKSKGSGTKDACYHKVKSRYSVWPSAYASGALVKCRKVGAANWGNKSEAYEINVADAKGNTPAYQGYMSGKKNKVTGKPLYKASKDYLDKAKGVKKEETVIESELLVQDWKKDDIKFTEVEAIDIIKPEPLNPSDWRNDVNEDVKRDEYGDPVGGPKISKKQLKKNLAANTPDEKHTTTTSEAMNPAQQAAIAISKKQRLMDLMVAKKKKKDVKEENLDEKCWKGYEKKGMKTMFGKRYPNCVKKKVGESMVNWRDELSYEGKDESKKIEEGKSPAWQRKEGKSESGGLNKKGVASYRAANPGSKLKTAVTTKPSKLKKGSKAANRRKSFCARMKGMKKRLTSAKTARDPDSRINKSLRKWNC